MNNWHKLMDEGEGPRHKSRRINKEVLCKKNKLGGGKYGHHVYNDTNEFCKLCGHLNKEEATRKALQKFNQMQEILKLKKEKENENE